MAASECTDKIAREIRAAAESGEYDLANYTADQVETLVSEAFTHPIRATGAVRCSFVVGGGKKVRQKYPTNLGKSLSTVLQATGFIEDKGAALTLECQGLYKFQHNTDTDLKHIHVFPRLEVINPADGADDGEAAVSDGAGLAGLPERVAIVVGQELAEFQQTVRIKVKTYGQQSTLHRELKKVQTEVATIESKLMAMEALVPSEQALYDGAVDIGGKLEWLSAQISSMIDAGKLGPAERRSVRSKLQSKLDQITTQLAEAKPESKKAQKLKSAKATFEGQLANVESSSTPAQPRDHALEIAEIEARIDGLQAKIDKNTATLDDMSAATKLRQRRGELAAVQDEKYWFTDPDLVDPVVVKSGKSKRQGAVAAARPRGGGWSTVGENRKGQTGSGGGNRKRGGGNGFAGLLVD